jgi:CRISPR/Cas system-associated exonuclease Cas4 (RecB family)
MPTPRGGLPFVWVSWLTGLLAGDQHCVYAASVKSHYRYTKRQDGTFNLAAWNADHSALLRRRYAELIGEGWRVHVEAENAFRLKGQCAVLAGKPDLIAFKDGIVRVIDLKTGAPRNKDWWQVLIYMFAIPRIWPELVGDHLEGEVAYNMRQIPIPARDLTPARVLEIGAMVQAVASDEPPDPRPSASECAFCDLADCTARIDTVVATATAAEF